MDGYDFNEIPIIGEGLRIKKLLRTPIFWVALAAALSFLLACGKKSFGEEIPEALAERITSQQPTPVAAMQLNKNGKIVLVSSLLFPPDLIVLTFVRYDHKRKSYYWHTSDVQEILRIQPNGKATIIWRKFPLKPNEKREND